MIAAKRMIEKRKNEDYWNGWHEGWTDGFESREWVDEERAIVDGEPRAVVAFVGVALSSALIGFLLGLALQWNG